MPKFPAAFMLTVLHADCDGCLSKQKQEVPNKQRLTGSGSLIHGPFTGDEQTHAHPQRLGQEES